MEMGQQKLQGNALGYSLAMEACEANYRGMRTGKMKEDRDEGRIAGNGSGFCFSGDFLIFSLF